MNRNQITKQQYVIWRKCRGLYPVLFSDNARKNATKEYEQAVEQAKLLHQQQEELKKIMLDSRDEDEPQQEMFVPPGALKAPLIFLLHGAGWNGGSQIEIWRAIAEREKIVLFAPTSLGEERDWLHPQDQKHIADKLQYATRILPIDAKRVYVVGHSRGGLRALRIARMNPEKIAAVGLHSPTEDHGVLHGVFPKSPRQLPVRVWAGSNHEEDCNRTWAELLPYHFNEQPEHHLDVDVKLLDHHRHGDYNTRDGLLDEIWEFLKDKSL